MEHYRRAPRGVAGHRARLRRERLSRAGNVSRICWHLRGDRAAAMEHYEQRRRQAALHGRRSIRRASPGRSATLHWQAGDRTEAMAAYRQALASLSGSGGAYRSSATSTRSWDSAAFRSGDNEKALEWSERAVQSAEQRARRAIGRGADPSSQSRDHGNRTGHQHHRGRAGTIGQLDAARERIERSLGAARDRELLDVACRAYANLGVLYSSVEPQRAIDVSLTGLELASKIGAPSLQSYIYANLAAAYCALTERCETERPSSGRGAP